MPTVFGSASTHIAEALTLLVVVSPLLVVAGALRWRRLRRLGGRALAVLAVELAIAVVASMVIGGTLFGWSGGGRQLSLDPWATTWSSGYSQRLFWGNLVLFAPLGLLIGLRGGRFGWIGLPLLVEAAQYALGNGRVASVEDVWTNAVGLGCGLAVGRLVGRWRPVRDRLRGS